MIVCLGILVADVVAKPIDALPQRGTLELIERVELHIGGNAANSATLLEFSPLGVPGFTLPLPTAFTGPTPPAGTPLAITESGSVSSSGYFSLQSNGMALTLGGYNAALGTTGVASSAPATIFRCYSAGPTNIVD